MNWVKPGKAFVAPDWYFLYDLTSKGAVQKFCHRGRPTDDTRWLGRGSAKRRHFIEKRLVKKMTPLLHRGGQPKMTKGDWGEGGLAYLSRPRWHHIWTGPKVPSIACTFKNGLIQLVVLINVVLIRKTECISKIFRQLRLKRGPRGQKSPNQCGIMAKTA